MAYIAGLLGGYWILRREATRPGAPMPPEAVDSLLNHVILGVILGLLGSIVGRKSSESPARHSLYGRERKVNHSIA